MLYSTIKYATICCAVLCHWHVKASSPDCNCSLNLLPWTAKWLVVPAHELQECSITSYLDLQWWHIIPSEHSSAASYNVSPKTVSQCKSLLMYISRKNRLSSFWKWKREHLGNDSWLFLYFPANNPSASDDVERAHGLACPSCKYRLLVVNLVLPDLRQCCHPKSSQANEYEEKYWSIMLRRWHHDALNSCGMFPVPNHHNEWYWKEVIQYQ